MAHQLMISAVLWMTCQVDRLRVRRWSDLPALEEDFIERLNLGLLKGFGRGSLLLGVARVWRGAVRRTLAANVRRLRAASSAKSHGKSASLDGALMDEAGPAF